MRIAVCLKYVPDPSTIEVDPQDDHLLVFTPK